MRPQDHYVALVQSSDDAIVAKDLDGIIVSWNAAAERIFGYAAEEMIGKSVRLLIPVDRQEEEDAILEKIRHGESVDQFLTERLHKSGGVVRLSVRVSPVRDKTGKVIGASKIARDASQFLDMTERLLRSEEHFRLLAQNITHFAWIARADGHIYWYNDRWYEYTGTTLEEMEGWGWTKVHHPDHVDRVVKKIQHSWDTGEPWEDTFPLRAVDGTYRWFLSRAVPDRNEAGEIVHWFGTNTDITEQLAQEEHIRLLLMEVNHRSKNLLMKIQAIARRTEGASQDFLQKFDDRLSSLVINQDILVRQEWREVPLQELISLQLRFMEDVQDQIALSGDAVSLNPRASETVSMAVHELATNSLKYGALSVPEGRVALTWNVDPETRKFTISWRETGGPAVIAPDRTGFGTTLIRDVPQRSLDAEVTFDFLPEGVVWSLSSTQALVAKD